MLLGLTWKYCSRNFRVLIFLRKFKFRISVIFPKEKKNLRYKISWMLVNKTISVQPHLPFSPPSFHGYLTSVLAPEGWGGGEVLSGEKRGGLEGLGGFCRGQFIMWIQKNAWESFHFMMGESQSCFNDFLTGLIYYTHGHLGYTYTLYST